MRSLEARFREVNRRNPRYTSYLCFTNAILYQGFNPVIMRRWFNKLVDKRDYLQEEKRQILKSLKKITQPRAVSEMPRGVSDSGGKVPLGVIPLPKWENT